MNKDTITTVAGASAATTILSQINFSAPGWWKQVLIAGFVAILGYYTNKNDAGAPPIAKA